jgi:RNA-directed DNA polymerase
VSGHRKATRQRAPNASPLRPRGVEDPSTHRNCMGENRETLSAVRGCEAADRPEKAMSYKTGMHGGRESYSGIVPAKHPNQTGGPAAEDVEGRPLAKENTGEPNPLRAQDRGGGPNGLARVREAAKREGKLRFTTRLHHVTVALLRQSYFGWQKQAAPGVDGTTWQAYGQDLEQNLVQLHDRVHGGAYRARPSRRVWIPKPDGRQRPLGIAALEDKILQRAVGRVRNQIWEEDFLGFSYGFRPGRKPHDALDALWVGITRKKGNWVLDADIRGFFDHIDHEWLVKFVEHRMGDRRVVRLIQKWLPAGVLEQGKWIDTEEGTPQGAVLSPTLANLYLHYVLDVWVEAWRKKVAHGDVIIVRYADDFVMGFQYREEAERFLEPLRERLRKFGRELHPEKTRRMEFGRFAPQRREEHGEGKPETFPFLGFTHICGRNLTTGKFTVVRRTMGRRMAAKLKDIRAKLRERLHTGWQDHVEWLRSVVRGYFQYHAIPGNQACLKAFRHEVVRLWWHPLRRRSQRHRWTWDRFQKKLSFLIPAVQILHPYPVARFDAKYPRQEPCAVMPPARVCAGGGQ